MPANCSASVRCPKHKADDRSPHWRFKDVQGLAASTDESCASSMRSFVRQAAFGCQSPYRRINLHRIRDAHTLRCTLMYSAIRSRAPYDRSQIWTTARSFCLLHKPCTAHWLAANKPKRTMPRKIDSCLTSLKMSPCIPAQYHYGNEQ